MGSEEIGSSAASGLCARTHWPKKGSTVQYSTVVWHQATAWGSVLQAATVVGMPRFGANPWRPLVPQARLGWGRITLAAEPQLVCHCLPPDPGVASIAGLRDRGVCCVGQGVPPARRGYIRRRRGARASVASFGDADSREQWNLFSQPFISISDTRRFVTTCKRRRIQQCSLGEAIPISRRGAPRRRAEGRLQL